MDNDELIQKLIEYGESDHYKRNFAIARTSIIFALIGGFGIFITILIRTSTNQSYVFFISSISLTFCVLAVLLLFYLILNKRNIVDLKELNANKNNIKKENDK
jgi:hypothetical protein